MRDLIERLEKATEGSRELDGRLWCHANQMRFVKYMAGTNDALHVINRYGEADVFYGWHWPAYTTSLDAALTLVPEDGYSNLAAFLRAAMWQQRIGDIPDKRIALVACIAALKARENADG